MAGERRTEYIQLGGMIEKIDNIDERTKGIEKKVDKHAEDLAALKVKAGLWGFASGAISTIVLALKLSWSKGGHG
jgi:predicted esterase